MKNILSFLIALFFFNACSNSSTEAVAVENVLLSQDAITLEVGEQLSLTAKVMPENATNPTVSWRSSNPEVAVVSKTGVVQAEAVGASVITVTTQDGNKSATCNVTVNEEVEKSNSIIVGYVVSWGTSVPDPTYLTHINYAFGTINMGNFTQIIVDNPDRLKNTVMPLKTKKPTLKILLSIGGWGTDGFSQMASTETRRSGFVASCKSVIDTYGLDGIDLDWEYPTSNMAGIAASPNDKANFTLLVQEIRSAIGNGKLLTVAAPSNADYYDFPSIMNYVDYINLMTYDMGYPPYLNAPLYPSSREEWGSCSESVQSYVNKGVPTNKLTLGIPFYGHGDPTSTGNEIPQDVEYYRIASFISSGKYTDNWDDIAKAPYLTNSAGKLVCSYDDPRSIAEKCKFILDKGMLGAMFWEYDQDDSAGTLREALYNGLNGTE